MKIKKKALKTGAAVIFSIAAFLVLILIIIPAVKKTKDTMIRLETTMGNITLKMYSYMPVTAGNFEKLVGEGFYNGIIFHRVMKGFMIQGGDPTGTGMGGPGYSIKDEFTAGNKNVRGTIAMANAGPNTGGSQFFINLVNNTHLNSKHPVFGEVVDGMDVVDAIARVPVNSANKPLTEVKIIKAEVIN
jgi:peptidylprolyl isomerase